MGLKCSLPAQTSSLLKWTPCAKLYARVRLKREGLGLLTAACVGLGPASGLGLYNLKNCEPCLYIFLFFPEECVHSAIRGIPLNMLCAQGAKENANVLIRTGARLCEPDGGLVSDRVKGRKAWRRGL